LLKLDIHNADTRKGVEYNCSGSAKMIIPVRCMTCGKTLAGLWRSYQVKVGDRADDEPDYAKKITKKKAEASADISRAQAMDELGLVRYCCRRHFLGQVDLIEKIG
jgi:DNA-directed RNA polymerase I, II, and III subunit RPABC5